MILMFLKGGSAVDVSKGAALVLPSHILQVGGRHTFHISVTWPKLIIENAICLAKGTREEVRLFNIWVVVLVGLI